MSSIFTKSTARSKKTCGDDLIERGCCSDLDEGKMVPLLVLMKGGAYLLVERIVFVFLEKAVST